MKRFLILLISIVFVTVSCAGPSKVRWTKPDFHQDQFEKDREDCIQAVKDDPEQKMTVEECLAKKGYESEPSSDKEKAKAAEAAKTVGKVLLVTAIVAVVVAAAAAYVVLLVLAGGH
jgi:cytochrome c-type biogenesis protein CcmH/NrfG